VLEDSNGKLLVYASALASHEKRLKSLRSAAERMAKLLNLNVEVVTFRERFEPMYVYYKNGDEEPIPIYCDKGEKADTQKICVALRNMMFVLSFHPRHSALRQMRNEIMRFS
jgi:tRNA U34 2-thiouridine synthase MnmA/TrmU